MLALIAAISNAMQGDEGSKEENRDRRILDGEAMLWMMAVLCFLVALVYMDFGVHNLVGAEVGEDWTFIEVEPDPESVTSKAKAKVAAGVPKAKAKTKAKNAAPSLYEVYFDDSVLRRRPMVLHFRLDCPRLLQTEPRRLRSCGICRGQVTPFSTVYFSVFGQCYHTSESCRGLRHRNTTYDNSHGRGCDECAESEL